MTPLKWTARIVGGGLFFVAVLWASAPARATEVNDLALCSVYGELIGVSKDTIHYYDEALATATGYNEFDIGKAIGYAKGYLRAVTHVRQTTEKVEAAKAYAKRCKVGTL